MLNYNYVIPDYSSVISFSLFQSLSLVINGNIPVKKSIDVIEHIWGYVGKLIILSRHSLNISLKICSRVTLGCRDLDAKVLQVVTKLKLFSIVGVPFSMIAAKNVLEKIYKSYALEDKE